jgi:hypothetical protein
MLSLLSGGSLSRRHAVACVFIMWQSCAVLVQGVSDSLPAAHKSTKVKGRLLQSDSFVSLDGHFDGRAGFTTTTTATMPTTAELSVGDEALHRQPATGRYLQTVNDGCFVHNADCASCYALGAGNCVWCPGNLGSPTLSPCIPSSQYSTCPLVLAQGSCSSQCTTGTCPAHAECSDGANGNPVCTCGPGYHSVDRNPGDAAPGTMCAPVTTGVYLFCVTSVEHQGLDLYVPSFTDTNLHGLQR